MAFQLILYPAKQWIGDVAATEVARFVDVTIVVVVVGDLLVVAV